MTTLSRNIYPQLIFMCSTLFFTIILTAASSVKPSASTSLVNTKRAATFAQADPFHIDKIAPALRTITVLTDSEAIKAVHRQTTADEDEVCEPLNYQDIDARWLTIARQQRLQVAEWSRMPLAKEWADYFHSRPFEVCESVGLLEKEQEAEYLHAYIFTTTRKNQATFMLLFKTSWQP